MKLAVIGITGIIEATAIEYELKDKLDKETVDNLKKSFWPV